MSALHRNALLPDEALCLRCGHPVELPADYCDGCEPSRVTVLGREIGQLIIDLFPVLIIALAIIFARGLPWIIGSIAHG